MKDFNFFAQYSGNRKDFKKEYLYAVVLSMGLILFISFTYAFNYFSIRKLNSEIVDIQQNLSSKENIVMLKGIEDEEKKLALMNQYHGIVVSISDGINNKDIIGSQLIDKINSCIPDGVHFKEITLDASGMQLKAEGKDREAVAVFERALRNLDSVDEVHVSIIDSPSTENEYLTFSIYCTLKDGGNYEGN
jgi:hypothetical protein